MVQCPFDNCNKHYKKNYDLKSHLIRMKCANDASHPHESPLWEWLQKQNMMHITPRKAKTPEEKIASRKASQKRYYQKTSAAILAKRAMLRKENKASSDLRKFRNKWEKLAEENPNRAHGIEIIDSFLESNAPQRPVAFNATSNITGSEAMNFIIHDIFAQSKSTREYHDINDEPEPNAEKNCSIDAIASLYSFEASPSADPAKIAPIATWSVPPSTKGLKGRIKIPEEIKKNGLMVDEDSYSTTVTTAGQCSSTHLDQFNASSLLVMLHGTKLFITWPPTEKNLTWLAENDYFGNIDGIKRGLKNLEEMEYCILNAGDYHVLRPGQLHAVLSPINSAVGGWRCTKDEWKPDIEKLEQIRQEIGIVEK